jgi:hypothetical protein
MIELFSQRALQKRHRVGDRNGPITLLTPPLRATLWLGLAIALGGFLWATLARIPISVTGTGVLLPVSTIDAMLSGADGTAAWMFHRAPEPWHELALRFKQRPGSFNDTQMLELARLILAADDAGMAGSAIPAGASMARQYIDSLEGKNRGRLFLQGRLLLWVQSSAQKERLSTALDHLQRTLRDTDAQARNIDNNQRTLRQELNSRSAYLTKMVALESRGFVSRASILQEQAQVDNIRSQINTNQNQLIGLDAKRDQAYQALRNQLAKLINEELIFSPRDVYLSQVIPNNGETVSRGAVVLQLSDDRLESAALVPVFLSSKEMAQVGPGMAVLATPEGYNRSEVGGIVGEVVSMATLPSSVDDIAARVGVKALAETIHTREPAPTMAVVELKRNVRTSAANSGGYIWSSRGSLPFAPTPGDRLDVEVTTRRIAPISLVLPALRNLFGLTPPPPNEAPAGSGSQQPTP